MVVLTLTVFLCITAALLLLMAGFWSGYLYKQYTVAQTATAADHAAQRLEALLHRYFADGKQYCESLSVSTRDLHTMVHQSPQVTPQLIETVEQISGTTNQFMKTLAAMEQWKSGLRDNREPRRTVAEEVPASSVMLTRQEMGTLTYDEPRDDAAESNSALRRYHFTCIQWAAVWMPDEPYPLASDFRPVKCRDLSAAGISFLWPDKPEFDQVVMAIGSAESPIYIVSEVAHSKAVFMFNEIGYLIDCKFKRRIEMAAEPQVGLAVKQSCATEKLVALA